MTSVAANSFSRTMLPTAQRVGYSAKTSSETSAENYQPSGRNYFSYDSYRLAYAEYGAKLGTPVLYFHDSGSSRLEAGLFHQSAQRNGFRIIALDRPGIGKSDFFACNKPQDLFGAVQALLAHLGLEHYGVMSIGAGGMFALSLAHAFPNKVLFNLSFAGVPGSVFNEAEKQSYTASCWNELTPLLIKMLVRVRHRLFKSDTSETLQRLEKHLCTADRDALADEFVFQSFAEDHQEALARGYKGIAQDLALCYRKLDFRLSDVLVPTEIWQGDTDRLSQRADCEYMAARIPQARYHRVANRGHFFFINRMDKVFDELRSVLSHRTLNVAA